MNLLLFGEVESDNTPVTVEYEFDDGTLYAFDDGTIYSFE